jgi:hypothetical protein
MAQATDRALQDLQAEHAPQVEGNPTGKSTVERAFGMTKTIAAPILELTDRLAAAVPALKQTRLAQAAAHLLLTVILRAYLCGGRAARAACEQRGDISIETLSEAAQQQRQQARADEQSKRLLLTHIHGIYDINHPLQRFIRELKRYPLEVLHQAERAFRKQVHRADIKKRAAYFSAIVRSYYDDWQHQRKVEDINRRRQLHLRRQWRQQQAVLQQREEHPDRWLAESLEMLAVQATDDGSLLFGGTGAGIGGLRMSLSLLAQSHGDRTAVDIATGVYTAFRHQHLASLKPNTLKEIETILDREIDPISKRAQKLPCTPPIPASIFPVIGAIKRPPPPGRLRN